MLFPVRCFTCGKVANKWMQFARLLQQGYDEATALSTLGCARFCCRRMYMSHVDMTEELLNYAAPRSNPVPEAVVSPVGK